MSIVSIEEFQDSDIIQEGPFVPANMVGMTIAEALEYLLQFYPDTSIEARKYQLALILSRDDKVPA